MRRVKDLTLRWVLPKQEYMERALKIWKQEELPTPKNPWYGYALGLWNAEDDEMAEAIARERAGQKRTATEG